MRKGRFLTWASSLMTGAVVVATTVAWGAAPMSDEDRRIRAQTVLSALERAFPGEVFTWRNPASGNSGEVAVGGVRINARGQRCRVFRSSVIVPEAMERQVSESVACRAIDGTWRLQPASQRSWVEAMSPSEAPPPATRVDPADLVARLIDRLAPRAPEPSPNPTPRPGAIPRPDDGPQPGAAAGTAPVAIEPRSGRFELLKTSNMRAGPGTDNPVLGVLREGETVTVTGKVQGENWLRIARPGGGAAYVHGSLLAPEGSVAERHETEPPAQAAAAPSATSSTGPTAAPSAPAGRGGRESEVLDEMEAAIIGAD